jgi:FKBP-type peptidyl-prolyl cis-trans isomerase
MKIELTTDIEKISYSLGINFAQSILPLPKKLDKQLVIQGVNDVFERNAPAITPEGFAECMRSFQEEMQSLEKKAVEESVGKNAEEQKAFLEKNKDVNGVKVTDSGLQYLVIEEGNGTKPTSKDTVKVHYTGTLLDGTVFDSSVERGEPATFTVAQVIPGWTEALQLMCAGSKYKLFIPSDLAYGSNSVGVIPPGAMLIFEVELLVIV